MREVPLFAALGAFAAMLFAFLVVKDSPRAEGAGRPDAGITFMSSSDTVYRSDPRIIFYSNAARELMFIKALGDGGSALCFPDGSCVSSFADGGTDRLHYWLNNSFDTACRPCPVCPTPTGNDAMAE